MSRRSTAVLHPAAPVVSSDPEAIARESASLEAPRAEVLDTFPVPRVLRTTSSDLPATLRRSFGTRPPPILRPAQQDDLFQPLPQMRISFGGGK